MEDTDKLIINGLEIEKWDETSGMGISEDSMCFELPNHTLIDKMNCDKIIVDLEQEETALLERVLPGIDMDKYQNKRVRIYIQPIGPIPRGR